MVLARLGSAGADIELVPVPGQRFVTLEVDVSGADTHASVLQRLLEVVGDGALVADFLRLRALPFTREVTEFVNKYDQVFIVEMNRDGQMNQLLTIEYPQIAAKFKSVAYGDGMPASAKWVREGILAKYVAPAKVKAAIKARSTAAKTTVKKAAAKKVASKSSKAKSSVKKTSVKKK